MEERYQVLGYQAGYQLNMPGAEQVDLGKFDFREVAEAQARNKVRHKVVATAQVMRTKDMRVVTWYDNEEVG